MRGNSSKELSACNVLGVVPSVGLAVRVLRQDGWSETHSHQQNCERCEGFQTREDLQNLHAAARARSQALQSRIRRQERRRQRSRKLRRLRVELNPSAEALRHVKKRAAICRSPPSETRNGVKTSPYESARYFVLLTSYLRSSLFLVTRPGRERLVRFHEVLHVAFELELVVARLRSDCLQ
jgi:hypothetical protein